METGKALYAQHYVDESQLPSTPDDQFADILLLVQHRRDHGQYALARDRHCRIRLVSM